VVIDQRQLDRAAAHATADPQLRMYFSSGAKIGHRALVGLEQYVFVGGDFFA
jgi:hypothetical protein